MGLHAVLRPGRGAHARPSITARSMFAFWMSGIEDRPERSGEICVAEMFGDAVADGTPRSASGCTGSATRC